LLDVETPVGLAGLTFALGAVPGALLDNCTYAYGQSIIMSGIVDKQKYGARMAKEQ